MRVNATDHEREVNEGVTSGGAAMWVFGYGSLMWRPGFAHEEAVPATVRGYHRAPCVVSHVHRGTPERPGVVLGLDRGGACNGLAFRVHHRLIEETLRYLREREQTTMVYLERRVPVRLGDGRRVEALTYVVDRTHVQYARRLGFDDLVQRIEGAVGRSGPNEAYFIETAAKLKAMGIRDALLERLAERLAAA